MPTFYVKYAGASFIEAKNEEEARKTMKHLAYPCATFQYLEVGKDVDDLGWPLPQDMIVSGPDPRD